MGVSYRTDCWTGTVRMKAESATRNVAVTVNELSGRSSSITDCTAPNSAFRIQGELVSWLTNRVYAPRSDVRPSIVKVTGGLTRESASSSRGVTVSMEVSQV